MIAPPTPANARLLHLGGALLLLGFLALGWIGSAAGIGSLDANGIISVVNDRIAHGAVEISRPPGHPLSEYWVLPNALRLVPGKHVLTPFLYGLYQLKGGLVALVLFWFLLGEMAVPPARRILAAACLAFSPQFLITSSDGEEFLWSMGLVFGAVLIVAKLSRGVLQRKFAWWCAAVVCAAAASGYRVEFGAVALMVVFGTLLFSDQEWRFRFCLAVLALSLLLVIWMPVLLHHVAPPYPNPLSLKTRIGVGAYKIAFHSLGIVPFLLSGALLVQSRRAFRLLPPFGKNILGYWALWLVVVFLALFFVYPTKVLEVMPGVAFLILLGAVYAGRATWACFVAACMSLLLVHLDCFQDRRFVGLNIQPSLWSQNLAEKPAAQLPQIGSAYRLAATGRHVVITKLWPWSFAWQTDHAAWPAVPDPRGDTSSWHEAYIVGPGIVASRNILDNHTDALKSYLADGYEIWIDQSLYREMYMRYDLAAPTPETATVEGLPARIVPLE